MRAVVRLCLIAIALAVSIFIQGERPSTPVDAAFPGDNGRLAFAGFASGGNTSIIYTVEADGTDLQELGPGLRPAWSPDGREIVYLDRGVWIMDAGGQNRQRVVEMETSVGTVDWSPDGSHLVYTISEGGQSSLTVVDRDGANAHTLQSIPDRPWGAIGLLSLGVSILIGELLWLFAAL